jgi:hypothetical protein
MTSEQKIYTPTLLWYQTKDIVVFNIELQEVSNLNVNITEKNISFSGISKNNLYEINFDLFESINKDESSFIQQAKSIIFTLKKNNSDYWKILTNDKNLYKNNIKINWNRWIDEDAEEDEISDDKGMGENFDFQQMMQSMGGMGDMSSMMGGMGDMSGMMDEQEEECEECEEGDENCECCVENIEEKEVNIV